MEFLHQCSIAFEQYSSLYMSLFLAGLLGSFTHCVGMCGPFVMAQSIQHAQQLGPDCTVLKRMSGAALLPYHFGRATTYIMLGATATFLSHQVVGDEWQQFLTFVMLSLAGLIFIINSGLNIGRLKYLFRVSFFTKIGVYIAKLAKPLFVKPTKIRGYLLGVLLGFLPCGLVFAAIMIVVTMDEVFQAALGMLFFSLGTVPIMIIISILGQYAYKKWSGQIKMAGQLLMFLNGVILFVMGVWSIL